MRLDPQTVRDAILQLLHPPSAPPPPMPPPDWQGPIQPPGMRAATPEERVVGRLEEEDPLNAELVRRQFIRRSEMTPPVTLTTGMRASTMGERLGDLGGTLKNALLPAWMREDPVHPQVPEPFHITHDPTMGTAAPGELVEGMVANMSRGLYSRVDDAVAKLPAKGAHPNKVASILKSNAPAEELSYRKVPEFLAGKGNTPVTPAELQAHLAAHPAPLPKVKTTGGEFDIDRELEVLHQHGYDVTSEGDFTDEPYLISKKTGDPIEHNADGSFVGEPEKRVPRAVMQAFERIQAQDVSTQTKFSQYQVPGGEAYRETLLTLPPPPKPNQAALEAEIQAGQARLQELYQQAEGLSRRGPDALKPVWAEIEDLQAHHRDLMREMSTDPPGQFHSGHFDEPNILVHTRSNERTLPTGERGRFIEEVQSDWHQKGKREGYASGPDTSQWQVTRAGEGNEGWWNVKDATGATIGRVPYGDPGGGGARTIQDALTEVARREKFQGVPNAPFKDTWPDLGLKQQILEAAADPHAQWIGHTSGQTQAARYDLSKQISRIALEPGHGSKPFVLSAFDLDGTRVMQEAVRDQAAAADYIGKEAAEKLFARPPQASYQAGEQFAPYPAKGVRELTGLDLQVGGEGMKHFYDRLLPKRLEKILKPFGGTVERTTLLGPEFPEPVTAGDFIAAEARRRNQVSEGDVDAWIARLTPEMKARLLKEGLPLSVLLALGAGSQLPQAEKGQQ